ncbi:MAG: LCP family protein [Clostridia bacterium]|nr:LCP family protein [Clostridia bacterium]
MSDTKREQKGKLSGWRLKLVVIAAVLLSLALAAVILVEVTLNRIERFDPNETPLPPDYTLPDDTESPDDLQDLPVVDPDSVWATPTPGESDATPTPVSDTIDTSGKDVTNILLIGQDRRPGESRARSDVMILVSLNKTDGRITMVSLMRDTYVQLEGRPDNRLNAAFAFGGAAYLCETIESNFGVHIDGTFEVDFSGFEACVDAVGGVRVNITEAEAEIIRAAMGDEYEIEAGSVNLNGAAALVYTRIRSLPGGDWQRTARQRRVIMALYNRFVNSNLTTIVNVLNSVLPYIRTDMLNYEIIDLASSVISMGLSDIPTYTVPYEGTYTAANVNGRFVFLPDLEANSRLLMEWLYGD